MGGIRGRRPLRVRAPKRTRGYSREFTPTGEGREFKIDRIPEGFWYRVKLKARREGVSLRALVLTFLREWLRPRRGRKRGGT